jgi:hypothetical protein
MPTISTQTDNIHIMIENNIHYCPEIAEIYGFYNYNNLYIDIIICSNSNLTNDGTQTEYSKTFDEYVHTELYRD